MYFEIYREGSGLLSSDWRWRLRSGNQEIIASGEGYTTKENCLHAINLIKSTNALTPVREI